MSGKDSIGEQGWCYAGEEEGEEIQPIETLEINWITDKQSLSCVALSNVHQEKSARERRHNMKKTLELVSGDVQILAIAIIMMKV